MGTGRLFPRWVEVVAWECRDVDADFPIELTKLTALGFAFGAACEELGIGDGSLEVAKRERVSTFLLKLVLKGETDIDVLHRRAVIHFRNTSPPLI